MKNVISVGLRIKERRKQLKMSAEELGNRLGKDRSTIYRYEKGEIENLPIELLNPIANALNTTPEYLMGWETNDAREKAAERAAFDVAVAKDEDLRSMLKMYMALPEDKKKTVKRMVEDYYNSFA